MLYENIAGLELPAGGQQ